MTDARGVLGLLAALMLVQAALACTTTADGRAGTGAEDAPVEQTWDLRETDRAAAVGFPEGTDLHTVSAEDGPREILLPGDVVVAGFERVGVTRRADGDRLDSMIATFPREPVEAVLDRAETWAAEIGADPQRIRDWAAVHAEAVDATSGATQAMTPAVQLGDGPQLTLSTRAFPVDGDALLRLELFWS